MSDAIGGVVNMVLILFFIVFIAGYMAFSINYQKAFNVKNKIISIYQESNGMCDADCTSKIKAYEDELGYGKLKINEKGFHCPSGYGYCVRGVQSNITMTSTKKAEKDSKLLKNPATKRCYFEIVTQVEIGVPIINNLMELRVFKVTGQTSTMSITNSKSCQAIAKLAK